MSCTHSLEEVAVPTLDDARRIKNKSPYFLFFDNAEDLDREQVMNSHNLASPWIGLLMFLLVDTNLISKIYLNWMLEPQPSLTLG